MILSRISKNSHCQKKSWQSSASNYKQNVCGTQPNLPIPPDFPSYQPLPPPSSRSFDSLRNIMTSVPAPRVTTPAIFAGVFILLLALIIFDLVNFDALGGLPLGLAGLLLVLARDVPDFSRDVPDFAPLQEKTRATVLIWAAAGALLFIAAVWINSTSLQLIALGVFAAGWLSQLFRWSEFGGLFVLLGLICLPVGPLQYTLLLTLQQVASVVASWGLDIMQIAHVRQGVVLETTRGNLFVEEACSGMQSLLTGLVVAQSYFCWHRKQILSSLVGLAMCTAFLVLGNSLRIFFIAWLYAGFSIDLTHGWRHEATGMAVYLLVLALLPSITYLLDEIGAWYSRWRSPWQKNPYHHRHAEPDDFELRPLVAVKSLATQFSKPLRIAVSLMAMAVLAEAVIFPEKDSAETIDKMNLPKVADIQLPMELAGWQRDSAASVVSEVEKLALDQHIWTFHKNGLVAWVAADLPYDHLHPLRLCYINRDWAITKEGPVVDAAMPFSFLELRSKENTRPPMIVCYDNFDLSANRYVGGPPDRMSARWEMIIARLQGKNNLAGGPYCLVQVVVAGLTDHQSPGGAESVELLTAAREYLATQLSSGPASPTTKP